ncbi:glutathione S-transferase family protein [Verminephrobacter eiseniae]|uniref:glutathione S-transferase family protein n=1 Tax=Verminephrobacter eiseniae TaxID=364317 RepID=UPI0010D62488|nr:glutathione S-transferase [Verminephrobacter eiseniae]KAB7597788.1 glutathione S-transferase family protein [Verminephrobacter sp. Larva24]MCW5232761.1 glutathione S-transferase family protein [Verminephrobacter eiseniae]MCW5295674.1 glutathione S-transferase family protein [Verminephrobacter eiseniae]MCW8186645.1 glutathione S-transferase family protein [Verminephrobacter eiseniae]MCW8221792.1 glutathione S-transferase family protein [Verminephrobacter eiseniae]
MLTLCGFAASNYYNKVKLALLEKGLPFTEELAWVGETDRSATPLGKVPYLLTPQGPLSESTVIADYIEAAHPQPALLPADPFAAAKVRELIQFMELYLEMVARKLYPQVFFGASVSESTRAQVDEQLRKNIAAFGQLAKFSPYVAGDSFTLADCAAIVHLPQVSAVTRAIYGRDYLADLPVPAYLARMAERPQVQRMKADRKTNAAAMQARQSH